MKEQEALRETQIEVFNAFTDRALGIVSGSTDKSGTLVDACRLVETALKALQCDEVGAREKARDAADEYVGDIARAYGTQPDEHGTSAA